MKLNKLEEIQHGIVKDVDELKQSLRDSQQKIEEKADRIDTAGLMRRIEDLENWSKRKNIVIWGMEEGSEGAYTSMEEFISVAIFQGLRNLEREVKVMRAHRTNIKQDANNNPKPRQIHVYLLRYTGRVFILKSAASRLKDNKYKNTQLFISDDVSRAVHKERAKLRKDYLPAVKAKTNVQFCLYPMECPSAGFV